MKKVILLLMTVFTVNQACSQKNYNEIIKDKSFIIEKEVINLNDSGATKILTLYDDSDNAFIFWEENDEFKGKEFIFKDFKFIKDKKVKMKKSLINSLSKSFENQDLLNEIKNNDCPESIRICKRIYLGIYVDNDLKVKNDFFYYFESKTERNKIDYFLDMYNQLVVW